MNNNQSKDGFLIRNEQSSDFRAVEELTREAFWNVYKPGADEHYLVHVMRTHPDFVPELAFVIEQEGRIVANIMYMKSWLEDESGVRKETLSFGPICVHPEYQRHGLGKWLIAHSFAAAKAMGYDTVVIFGNPENYVCSGFKSSSRFNVCLEGGIFPTSLMVAELIPGVLDGRRFFYRESDVCSLLLPEKIAEFDRTFPEKEPAWQPSQEKFYIYSHSQIHS